MVTREPWDCLAVGDHPGIVVCESHLLPQDRTGQMQAVLTSAQLSEAVSVTRAGEPVNEIESWSQLCPAVVVA